jgi:arginine decarboxylase
VNWTSKDSEQLYNVPRWSGGYFRINGEGNVECVPDGSAEATESIGPSVDIFELVSALKKRGIDLPVLLRFDGVLQARVAELYHAFDTAREEFNYKAPYQCIYPIKVNQQRQVVEGLLGSKEPVGLEVGSKPELIAGIALLAGQSSIVICNGYKDHEYIETALLASRIGLQPIIVIEKMSELGSVIEVSQRLHIRPKIGLRTKLAGRGSGRWKDSAGVRSKFGLTTREIVDAIATLKEHEMLDTLQLLHFHLGSQITTIRALKDALKEATRTLIGLHQLGATLQYFDVGGGLGIDYDGSRTDFDSSRNYSLQEYANDIVYQLAETCREAGVPELTILTESGRALTAHHSVLVTEVLGTTSRTSPAPVPEIPEDAPELLYSLESVYTALTAKNYQESYHNLIELREQSNLMFQLGQLSLEERAISEDFYWRACQEVFSITRKLEYVPDDLEDLERDLAETYYLNFSLFQSVPDSWAIEQLFPIIPIQRHNEKPDHRATLADITCDSDGKVDRFINLRGVGKTLPLHGVNNIDPYYVGFFLVGAYQEILGDMHNLFGDTNAVHIAISPEGRPKITHVVRGDRVQDVLSYVEYFETDLLDSLRRGIEKAIDENCISFEDSAALQQHFESGLRGTTYLKHQNSGNSDRSTDR